MKLFLWLLLSLCTITSGCSVSIDKSSQIFFPQTDAKLYDIYQKTPATWWNFLFYNKKTSSKESACAEIKNLNQDKIIFSPCNDIPLPTDWLIDWARYQTVRESPPNNIKALQQRLNQTMAKMSLPLPGKNLDLLSASPLVNFSSLINNFVGFYKMEENKSEWGGSSYSSFF